MADLAQALNAALQQPSPQPDPGSASKRKRDGDSADGPGAGQSGTRSKRSRYISIACNECKRRKIKCNGENPCQRCGNLTLDCVYAPNCCSNNFKDSPEFKQITGQLSVLQDQVGFLLSNLNTLRGALGQEMFTEGDIYYQSQVNQASVAALSAAPAPMIDPALQTRKQGTNQPRFQGPTSPAFSLGLARSSLQSMGITGTEEGTDEFGIAQESLAAELARSQQAPAQHPRKDPLWALDKDEVLRLCGVYEDEVGVMHPILDIHDVKGFASLLYTLDAAARHMGALTRPPPEETHDESTEILRLVLAIGLVAEGTGQSELGQRLFDSVNQGKNFRMLESPNLKDIQIAVLMAIFHFHVDNEDLAWRVIGLAARLGLELGLHRNETYERHFNDEAARSAALNVFWSIYVLDRRWSYGTGRSFAIQESDIDPNLPRPIESSPYLGAMISYSAICTKAWKFIASAESNAHNEIQYLEYEIVQWLRNIPDHLRYLHPASAEYGQHTSDPNEADGRVMYKLRVILYLRANQARLSIYRPSLSSATSILTGSPDFAQTPVDVAKDTIRVLHHVNQTSDIYRTAQMAFNYFLLSALAVLFLAVSHAPAQFAETCRQEFYMALEIVRGLSAHSYVSKRLWRTIRGLKEVGPKIGLYTPATASDAGVNATNSLHTTRENSAQAQSTPQPPQPRQQQHLDHDAHSSAAMAMAGLAGHHVEGNIFNSTNANSLRSDQPGDSDFVASPNVMARDLTNLFEAAGIFAAGPTAATMQAAAFARDGMVHAGDSKPAMTELDGGRAGESGVGTDEDLNRVMREMF